MTLQSRGRENIKPKEIHKRLTLQSGHTKQVAVLNSDRKRQALLYKLSLETGPSECRLIRPLMKTGTMAC